MFRKTLALFLLAAVLAPQARAQSLDDILAKHFQAQGGLENFKKVQTTRMIGHMEVGPGMEAPLTLDKKRPAMQRMDFVFSGMTGTQAFDGQHGWHLMPFMGQKDPEVMSDEESKQAADQADFDGPLVDAKAKGNTIELAGKESVDGADAYKLKVTKKGGGIEYYFLDAESYLLVKKSGTSTMRGTEMETETTFGNYKQVAGLMFPTSLSMGAKGMDHRQTITIDSIAVNVVMDDAHFAVPAAADSTKPAAPKPADSPKKK